MNDRRTQDRRTPYDDPELQERIESELGSIEDPLTRQTMLDLREEGRQLARANGKRLDQHNSYLRTLLRRVTVIMAAIFIIQLVLGIFGVHLQVQGQTASHNAGTAAHNATDALHAVQKGRSDALKVTCSVQSAIAQAGKQVISGAQTKPPAAQERALEALGFPPFKVRQAQAKAAAAGYVTSISRSIETQIGAKKSDRLVNKNGTLNCARLAQVARVG